MNLIKIHKNPNCMQRSGIIQRIKKKTENSKNSKKLF